MADRKITDLTALAAGSQATGDLLTIVDVSEGAAADKNKKITVENLLKGIPSNVGIGTSAPSTKLHIADAAAPEFRIEDTTNGCKGFMRPTDSAVRLGVGSNNPLLFFINGSERMQIDTSGRVGIGDSSPDFGLVIKGGSNTNENLFACKDSDGTKMVSVEQDSSGHGRLLVFDTSGNNDVLLHTSGNSFFNGGNTGFGTTSPNFKLDVNGEVGITEGQRLSWHDGDGARSAGIFGGSGDVLVFTTTSSNTERMRIDSSGRVQIGTTSGIGELNVASVGDAAIDIISDSDNNGSNNWPIINFRRNSATGTPAARIYQQEANNALVFDNNGSERVRIQSGGGISFNGDTAAANALDDYEEGSWTPAAFDNSNGASTQVNRARYTKIGNRVCFECYINVSKGTNTGNYEIHGLPYNSLSASSYHAGVAASYFSGWSTSVSMIQATVQSGSDHVLIRAIGGTSNTGTVSATGSFLNATTEIIIGGTYEAA